MAKYWGRRNSLGGYRNSGSRQYRPPADGASEATIAKVLTKVPQKNSISQIVRTPQHVGEVESYAPSTFQPPTLLGDPQKVEQRFGKKLDFFESQKSVFRHFS